MHPPILEGRARPGRRLPTARPGPGPIAATLAICAAAGAAGAAPPHPAAADCPVAAHAVVEHFVGAACPECWSATPAVPGQHGVPGAEVAATGEWSIDWIVPAGPGPGDGTADIGAGATPLAAAALPESTDRLVRLDPHLPVRLQVPPAGFDTVTPLARPGAGRRLWIHSSLPYQGYFGVQMHARGAWPAGATGWIALVELLPAGEPGPTGPSAIERHVVRALTGPVALPAAAGAGDAVAPLFAMRWPDTARPDRLVATAWIEGRDGRILQLATDRCADPK